MGLSRPLSFIHLGCSAILTNPVNEELTKRPGEKAQWIIVFSVQGLVPDFRPQEPTYKSSYGYAFVLGEWRWKLEDAGLAGSLPVWVQSQKYCLKGIR